MGVFLLLFLALLTRFPALASFTLRDQLKLLLILPLIVLGSSDYTQALDNFASPQIKDREELENFVLELWSHPVPPGGLSCLQGFIVSLRLLAGS